MSATNWSLNNAPTNGYYTLVTVNSTICSRTTAIFANNITISISMTSYIRSIKYDDQSESLPLPALHKTQSDHKIVYHYDMVDSMDRRDDYQNYNRNHNQSELFTTIECDDVFSLQSTNSQQLLVDNVDVLSKLNQRITDNDQQRSKDSASDDIEAFPVYDQLSLHNTTDDDQSDYFRSEVNEIVKCHVHHYQSNLRNIYAISYQQRQLKTDNNDNTNLSCYQKNSNQAISLFGYSQRCNDTGKDQQIHTSNSNKLYQDLITFNLELEILQHQAVHHYIIKNSDNRTITSEKTLMDQSSLDLSPLVTPTVSFY